MALPKAILCLLGDAPVLNPPEEAALRAAGFATATIPWNAVAKPAARRAASSGGLRTGASPSRQSIALGRAIKNPP